MPTNSGVIESNAPLALPSDVIDANIGELSEFHDTHGYYVQGVDIETAALPAQWRTRLVKIQDANTDLRVGYGLHPTDLAAAKLVAGRERDGPFVSEMLFHGLVLAEDLIAALKTVRKKCCRCDALSRCASGSPNKTRCTRFGARRQRPA